MLMEYKISGTSLSGAVALRRDSAVGAIKKAVELMDDGYLDVMITAPDGRIYGHPEFDELSRSEKRA
jgi:hypothetical protein